MYLTTDKIVLTLVPWPVHQQIANILLIFSVECLLWHCLWDCNWQKRQQQSYAYLGSSANASRSCQYLWCYLVYSVYVGIVYGSVIGKYAFDTRLTLVPWPKVKQIVNILLLCSIECLPWHSIWHCHRQICIWQQTNLGSSANVSTNTQYFVAI